jgi:general secretion pathway protein M
MSKAWNDLVESLAQRWGALAIRERRMLSLGLAVIGLAVLYFVLFEPAYLGRKKLQEELPALRSQALDIRALWA